MYKIKKDNIEQKKRIDRKLNDALAGKSSAVKLMVSDPVKETVDQKVRILSNIK